MGQLKFHGLFKGQAEAYRAFSSGSASVLPVQTAGQKPYGELKGGPNSQVCIKSGYMHFGERMVTKVAAGGAEGHGNSGFIVTLSQHDLKPEFFIQDEGILTEIRTAAAAALGSVITLNYEVIESTPDLEIVVGMVGCGVQGLWQLRLLAKALHSLRKSLTRDKNKQNWPPLKLKAKVKSRTFTSAKRFCDQHRQELTKEGGALWNELIPVDPEGEETRQCFQDCTIIHTATYSREPVLQIVDLGNSLENNWPNNPFRQVRITCTGADSPGKRELSEEFFLKNLPLPKRYFLCDSIKQSRERGELQYLGSEEEEESSFSIREIGELLQKQQLLKSIRNDENIVIFDTSGIAVQDVAISNAICEHTFTT